MHRYTRELSPLLTLELVDKWRTALSVGQNDVTCSLDLQRTSTTVRLEDAGWIWQKQRLPYPARCKARTIYFFENGSWQPIARFSNALVKLVPTQWGAPTFEIDGIKMLPSQSISPYQDAERKVALIDPRGKVVLDTCGGLGYFAAWCLDGRAAKILSYEHNADVLWLRQMNPWSPQAEPALELAHADVGGAIAELADRSVDAILHDPPRFGIAGELYSTKFYSELARVIKRRGRLFHYTGTPNQLSSGRDLPHEVTRRLHDCGFSVERVGDGLLAQRK